MAIRRSKPSEAPPQPLQTYGLRLNSQNQFHYDCLAFAKKTPIDQGAPTRIKLFQRISDRFLPGHFEWHEWSYRIIENLCDNSIVGLPGCSNCVAGETRILNPITGESPTIKELCESNSAPVVMTLNGPAQAGVPFVKGNADLFEVTLQSGRKFLATLKHRVLVSRDGANHWCHVGDLQIGELLVSYAPNLQESTSEPFLSNQLQDVPYSQKTTEDCQARCWTYSRPCDELLHLEEDTFQSFSPSQVCALEHSYASFDVGALRSESLHNHACPSLFHLSTYGSSSHHNSFYTPSEHRSYPGIPEHEFQLSPHVFQSALTANPPELVVEPPPCFSHRHLVGESCQPDFRISSLGYTVSRDEVVSIRNTGKDLFYDITVPGPAHYFAEGTIHHNSCKTFNVMSFACVWWLAAPDISSVTIVSTSIKSLRRRGWAEVQKCHTTIPGPRVGNFVDSRMIWAIKRGDDKHAIIGKAVEEGSTAKVADDIKGVHTRRQMVIIDEATAVPEAIYDACGNLYSYPEEFILVTIGNPRNRLDQFGRFCEPAGGWTSVTVESGEWESGPIPYIGGRTAKIITFDAEKSPNITEGKVVSRHLPTKEKVEAARNTAGGQTPNYWSNFRGFWPPEGLSKTVFSESALIANDGFGQLIFTGRNFSIIGMFDPAFGGGDRPALRFAKMGETETGKWGIEVFKPIILPIDAHSKNPVHFQLAEQLRRSCESFKCNGNSYTCPPENLAVDATGEGGGLCDIINRTWSPNIIRIEFGGKASEDAASLEDVRPANEVYENKRVEIYFRARNALNSGQLKGIDRETALEVCTLEFDDSGKRIKLQKKSDYKLKFGKSPDLGDCLVGLTEVARRRGFQLSAVGTTVERVSDFNDNVKKAQEVYESISYEDEPMEEAMV